MEITSDMTRIRLAAFQLEGEAQVWRNWAKTSRDLEAMTWAEFCRPQKAVSFKKIYYFIILLLFYCFLLFFKFRAEKNVKKIKNKKQKKIKKKTLKIYINQKFKKIKSKKSKT